MNNNTNYNPSKWIEEMNASTERMLAQSALESWMNQNYDFIPGTDEF
jgi:hypothetical protein